MTPPPIIVHSSSAPMRTSNEPRWSIGSNGLRQTAAWWQTDAVLTVAIAHDAHVVAVTPRAAKARLVQAALK